MSKRYQRKPKIIEAYQYLGKYPKTINESGKTAIVKTSDYVVTSINSVKIEPLILPAHVFESTYEEKVS